MQGSILEGPEAVKSKKHKAEIGEMGVEPCLGPFGSSLIAFSSFLAS